MTNKLAKIIYQALFIGGLALLMMLKTTDVAAVPPEQIQIEVHHLLIKEADQGVLEVREIARVNNTGSEIATDPNRPLEEQAMLEFHLPAGYTDFQVNDGLDEDRQMVKTDTGWAIAGNIPAGTLVVDFQYHISEIPGAKYMFQKEILYPTEEINFLSPEWITLMGENLHFAGVTNMGATRFNYYYYESPQVGAEMTIVVRVAQQTGAGGEQAQQQPQNNLERGYTNTGFHSPAHIRFWNKSPFSGIEPHLFLAVVIIGMLALLYITVKKLWSHKQDEERTQYPAGQDKELTKLLTKEQVLLNKIVEAQEQLDKDEIDQDTFDQLVKVYKQKLVEVRVSIKLLEK